MACYVHHCNARHIFHRRVWYRTISLCYACIQSSGIILIPWATFVPNFVSFMAPTAELAYGEKSCTHSLTHPAYLMPWKPKLSLWNMNCLICYYTAYFQCDSVLDNQNGFDSRHKVPRAVQNGLVEVGSTVRAADKAFSKHSHCYNLWLVVCSQQVNYRLINVSAAHRNTEQIIQNSEPYERC